MSERQRSDHSRALSDAEASAQDRSVNAERDLLVGQESDAVRDWQNFRQLLRLKHAKEGGRPDALVSTEAVYSALRMVTRLQNDFELLHREFGLTWAGFRVLNVLWVCGPSEVRDIARHLGVARPSVSSAISTLEQSGLVGRERQARDRRLVVVEMTASGRRAFQRAVERQADQQQAWLDVLSRGEQEVLVDLLNRLLDRPSPTGVRS